MSKRIEKKVSGYRYSVKGEDWSVETDYFNGNIYLDMPHDEDNLSVVENYGRAILQAVKDMKKDN